MFFLFLSLSCFPLVSFLSPVWLFLLWILFAACHFIASGNMAHSSAHIRAAPERSRSRDDPMWQPRPSQHRNTYCDSWQDVPSPPRLRNVLVIVDLEGVRSHMIKVHDDIMESTTRDVLPALSRSEELALFTYNVLLNTQRLDTFTVYNLLYTISQHIWYTWDRYLRPSSMDIRWQDETGDTFALHNEDLLVDLLHEHRPHWTEGQECGILFPGIIRHFASHFQPYIMRVSCHEALPNRNMLP